MRTISFLIALLILGLVPNTAYAARALPPEAGDDSSSAPSSTAVVAESQPTEAACTGIIGALRCLFNALFNFTVSNSFTVEGGNPLFSLFTIQKQALTKSSAGDFEGSIARLLPPGYQQDGLDPREALIKTENQSVPGFIFINDENGTKAVSEGTGTYTVKNRQIAATFEEIAPLADKFGFLRQAFSPPGTYKASLPTEDFGPQVTPGKVSFESVSRDVKWDAKATQQAPPPSPDPSDPDCPNYSGPSAEGDGTCNQITATQEVGVKAHADLATKVPLAAAASENILSLMRLFLPPGSKFNQSDNIEDVKTTVGYSGKSGKGTSDAFLPIKGLGGAVNAYRCVTEQLLLPPGAGATGLCEKALKEAPPVLGASDDSANQPPAKSGDQPTDYQPDFWSSFGQWLGNLLGSLFF